MRSSRSSAHAFGRKVDVVRLALAPKRQILDRTTCKPRSRGEPNRFGNTGRIVGVTILEIGAHGKIG